MESRKTAMDEAMVAALAIVGHGEAAAKRKMSRSEFADEVAEITADSVNNAEALKPAEDPDADVQMAAAEAAEAATRRLLSQVQLGDGPVGRGGWTGSRKRRGTKKRRGGWTGSRKKKRGGWTGSRKKKRGGWTGSKKKKRGGWTGSKKKRRGGWSGSKKKKRGGWTGSKKKRQLGGYGLYGGGGGGYGEGGYTPYYDDYYDDFDDEYLDDVYDDGDDYGFYDEYYPLKKKRGAKRYLGGAEACRIRYGYPADYFAGDPGLDGDGDVTPDYQYYDKS